MKMKRALSIGAVAATMLACSLASTPPTSGPGIETVVAGTVQALVTPTAAGPTAAAPTSAPAPTQAAETQVMFGNVSFAIPAGLASGASAENVPAVADQGGPTWDVAPAFTRFTLQAYPLSNEFFQPQIMVYPAQAYAAVNNGASLSIQRLESLLANPTGSMSNDVLPRLPYANAEQIIGAQPKVISFKGGQGIRVLAEYSQGFVQIDNHDLFYHFEGLTSDNQFYVVAVLPVNASFLAASGDPTSPAPPDGIPFPSDIGDGTPVQKYLQAVTDKLNSTSPDAFRPPLAMLDALIQSLLISP